MALLRHAVEAQAQDEVEPDGTSLPMLTDSTVLAARVWVWRGSSGQSRR